MKFVSDFSNPKRLLVLGAIIFSLTACADDTEGHPGGNDDIDNVNGNGSLKEHEAIFIYIDEDSIDNGNEPNNFSEVEVNDNLADIGQRGQLRYFQENVGRTIDLYTGQVGDEGWHAPKSIPGSWKTAGPTTQGLLNYLVPGPGLGGGQDDREVLLDEIRDVIPLRATALAMLAGETVYAVVYDSDLSTNYGPIQANLQGANLGTVAFRVVSVDKRGNGSDSDLPRVTITILDASKIDQQSLYLFKNSPEPTSSSEPEDTDPPVDYPKIQLEKAN